jgi:hypothetical protein
MMSSLNRTNELLTEIVDCIDGIVDGTVNDTDAKRWLQESVGWLIKDLEPVGKFLNVGTVDNEAKD